MKLFCVILTFLTIASLTLSVKYAEQYKTEFEKLNSEYFASQSKNPSGKKNSTIHFRPRKNVPVLKLHGDVYWSGWVKYFRYEYFASLKKPDSFYRNPEFYTQKIAITDREEEDLKGIKKHIPTAHHFWGKLLATGNFNILSSRDNEDSDTAHTVDNLNTDTIKQINKHDNANGAVKDLGSFHEGHCLSVATLKPDPHRDPSFNPRTGDGDDQTWVICTDKLEDKKYLMSYLISLKIKRQEFLKDELIEKKPPIPFKSASELMNSKPFMPKIKRGGPSHLDGYLILLQDWSPCSVKCGGGISTQQWLCVPPKPKGRPCPGDTIITRKCNKKPCPGNGNSLNLPLNDKNHVTLKPIYAALPFSSRPQNYVQCEIKESDVLYLTKEYDPENKKYIEVPARMIMNTKTVSLFRDSGYDRAIATFNLKETAFSKSDKNHCCFYLTNQNREHQVCAFGSNCGTKKDPVWVNGWLRDSSFFLNRCHNDLEIEDLRAKLRPRKPVRGGGPQPPNSGGGLNLPQMQQDMVEGKRSIIQKQVQNNLEQEMDKKVDETQKVALTALRREINLEDLIKSEEVEKGNTRTEELKVQIKQEKKKKAVLKKALMAREQSYAQVRISKDTQLKMDNIKHETKVDIKFKRSLLKKKIELIRNKFKRRHRLLEQQIRKIRSEMANEIMEANKNGNSDKCKEARNDIKKISDYCDENETSDYVKNQSCKEPTSFCYRCCEIEFGNMFIVKRDDCQSMCDELEKKEFENGDWIWTTGVASK